MIPERYKFTLLSLIFFLPAGLFAQITISSTDMPSAGDTIRYSIVQAAPGVDFKSTGAGKSWDFTGLRSNSQGLYEYKSSISTPYIINFGFTAIGLKIADSIGTGQIGFTNVYNFFKKSTSKWEAVGLGFQLSAVPLPQAGKNTNNDEIYQFPMNYQDRDSSTFALKIPITAVILPIGNYYQDGKRINLVDGYGTISTPYQSNVACLRIKSVITETDSLAISISGQAPINFKFPNNRIEYKWLTKTEKIPILEVSGTEIGGTFTPTTIRYRDNYRSTFNPLAPVADFTADKLNPAVNETVTFTDKSTNAPSSYNWVITPSTFTFTGGTSAQSKNPQVQFTANGKYTIKLTAGNFFGNGTTTKTNYIQVGNASTPVLTPGTLRSWPNPCSNELNIEFRYPENDIRVFVFDMNGKLAEEIRWESDHQQIRIHSEKLAAGDYTTVIHTGSGIYTSRFRKN